MIQIPFESTCIVPFRFSALPVLPFNQCRFHVHCAQLRHSGREMGNHRIFSHLGQSILPGFATCCIHTEKRVSFGKNETHICFSLLEIEDGFKPRPCDRGQCKAASYIRDPRMGCSFQRPHLVCPHQDTTCSPLPSSQLPECVLEEATHFISPHTMSCLCVRGCLHMCAHGERGEGKMNTKTRLHSYRNQHCYSPTGKSTNFLSAQQGNF